MSRTPPRDFDPGALTSLSHLCRRTPSQSAVLRPYDIPSRTRAHRRHETSMTATLIFSTHILSLSSPRARARQEQRYPASTSRPPIDSFSPCLLFSSVSVSKSCFFMAIQRSRGPISCVSSGSRSRFRPHSISPLSSHRVIGIQVSFPFDLVCDIRAGGLRKERVKA